MIDFNKHCYDVLVFTQSHGGGNDFLVSFAVWNEPKRDEFKAEYFSPFINFDEAATWIMRVKLNE